MKRATLLALVAALASCGRPSAPPVTPTTEELGAELATFSQVLAPLSAQSSLGLKNAAELKGGLPNVTAADFPQSYELGSLILNGRNCQVMIAYANPWLAPADTPNQALSVAQFFRAFEAEQKAAAAVLIAPKGEILITREQLPGVRAKALSLGLPDVDLPFALIRGNRR